MLTIFLQSNFLYRKQRLVEFHTNISNETTKNVYFILFDILIRVFVRFTPVLQSNRRTRLVLGHSNLSSVIIDSSPPIILNCIGSFFKFFSIIFTSFCFPFLGHMIHDLDCTHDRWKSSAI